MLYYTMKFSTMNPFERAYIGIHDTDPIQFDIKYHGDAIHLIEFTGDDFSSLRD